MRRDRFLVSQQVTTWALLAYALTMSGHAFLNALTRSIDQWQLRDAHLLLAVSGGADSVAMLRGLMTLADAHGLRITVAHLNHGLRGDAGARDSQWVRQLCAGLDVPCVIDEIDVVTAAGEGRHTVEEAARKVRYRFLEQTALAHGCTHIATAHTADDQAETILHHILRGTGLAGLQGMPARRRLPSGVTLVRPLLDITRSEIEQELASLNQPFVTDETNTDRSFTRNRIRHELMPLLQRTFNPNVIDALRRLGRQAGDAQAVIDSTAARLLDTAVLDISPDSARLDRIALGDQPPHLIREALRLLWIQQSWPRQKMGHDDWHRVATLLMSNKPRTSMDLAGGVRVEVKTDEVRFDRPGLTWTLSPRR